MSKENYLPPSVFQDEKKNIHFDRLMEQVQTVLQEQSGDLWTDVTAHDPGITLLEALAYNVSDLAYRHLLPLVDLLTTAGGNTTLFPAGFEPEQMLTTSPVTADDYRKGTLDLYYQKDEEKDKPRWCYYFSDAEFLKIKDDERWRYFYNSNSKEFYFNQPAGDGVHELHLNGVYRVRAKPNYLIRDFNVNVAECRQKLNDYLAKNRNLCEQFSTPEISDFPADNGSAQPLVLNIAANTSVTDDNVNQAFLDVFLAAQQILYPVGERLSKIDFSQTDYSGPRPEKGWIVDFPPASFGDVLLSASQVKQKIESLPWVTKISYISFAMDKTCWMTHLKHSLAAFWLNSSSIEEIIGKMMEQVTIKRGEKILQGNAEKIYALLQQQQQTVQLPAERFPAGNDRKTSRYYPASDLLPALYDLQVLEPAEQVRQLHQFLLPFEQLLADGCAQLAHLPELLNFSSTIEQPIWGQQWPFASGTPNDDVHKEYKEAASAADFASQQNIPQQIALANYLQSYFGLPKNENIGFTTDAEFLQVQRAFLRSLPETGYARTAIHIGGISSLQRRVAARLGIGAKLFEAVINLRQLPFYVIEHPLLMPRVPGSDFVDVQKVTAVNVYPAPADNVTPKELVITADEELTGKLQPGQLVDLLLDGKEGETLKAVLVAEVQDKTFKLYINEHKQLRLRWKKAVEVGVELQWQTSNLWLKDMQYQWVLGDQKGVSPGEIRIATAADQPWPPALLAGDTLSLERSFTGGARSTASATPDSVKGKAVSTTFSATVKSVDAIKGEAVISLDNGDGFDPEANYQWSISKGAAQNLDRFSFTLSFVFRRRLIMQGQPSPATLAEREMRIKRIVQEEIPAHLRARVLWLSDTQFDEFAATYVSWQNSATRLGSDAYNLLRMLSIGMLPMASLGIGVMRIATQEEFNGLPSNEPARQEYIENYGLFFVPKTDLAVKSAKK
ncbi:hypothetical protein SME10J_23780 [Serratia marcescens]|nr:hypothetical protein SME10J_23780 [Serratia marcescens]